MNPFNMPNREPDPNTSVQVPSQSAGTFAPASGPQAAPLAGPQPNGGDVGGYSPYPTGYPPYPPFGQGLPPSGPAAPGPPAAPRRKRTGRIILSTVLAVVVVGALVAASALYVVKGGSLPGGLGKTSHPSPTATPILPAVLTDSLTVNQQGWSDDSRGCFFQNGGYHVVAGASCFAPAPALGTERISIHASVVQDRSGYQYGVQFWQQPTLSLNCYAFLLDTAGGWQLFKTVNNQDTVLVSSHNAAIHRGTGATNTLEVRATVGRIELFVNGASVGRANDSTFTHGRTALFGDPGGEIAFTTLLISGQADTSPAPPPGSVLTHDPLTSDLGNLPPDPTAFQADGYHMTGSAVAPYGYNNLAEVNIAVTERHTGSDAGDIFGIALRYAQHGNGYLFVMTPDGSVGFLKLANYRFTLVEAFKPGVIIRTGSGAVNTLEVRATGSRFECYLNNVDVGGASDRTFAKGLPGLVSVGGETAFTDLYMTSGS